MGQSGYGLVIKLNKKSMNKYIILLLSYCTFSADAQPLNQGKFTTQILHSDSINTRALSSFTSPARVITATTTLTTNDSRVVVQNGATAITITLPPALPNIGRTYIISRYAGSTGTITIQSTSSQIQALNGNVGASTTIGAHSAAGLGLQHSFTAVSIGGVGVWVRI